MIIVSKLFSKLVHSYSVFLFIGDVPLSILGSGFGASPVVSDAVKIGGEAAEIVYYSDTKVDVILPSLPQGSYPVKLYLGNTKGFADLRFELKNSK